jgi:anti-anti-sigma regulatory factor
MPQRSTGQSVGTSFEPCSTVVSCTDESVTMRVRGELDSVAFASVAAGLAGCAEVELAVVVIDLREVTFISASACQAVQRAVAVLAADGRNVTLLASHPVRRVVELVPCAGLLIHMPGSAG